MQTAIFAKKLARNIELFHIFVNIFNAWLIEDRHTIMLLHSLLCGALFEVKFMEKVRLPQVCSGEGVILMSSQVIVGILSRWQFLKISYIVESEIHVKEPFVSVMVKSIGLSFSDFFFTHAWFLWHQSLVIENISLLCWADSSKYSHI